MKKHHFLFVCLFKWIKNKIYLLRLFRSKFAQDVCLFLWFVWFFCFISFLITLTMNQIQCFFKCIFYRFFFLLFFLLRWMNIYHKIHWSIKETPLEFVSSLQFRTDFKSQLFYETYFVCVYLIMQLICQKMQWLI